MASGPPVTSVLTHTDISGRRRASLWTATVIGPDVASGPR